MRSRLTDEEESKILDLDPIIPVYVVEALLEVGTDGSADVVAA
jgi:hypothetical protein